jgi:hypothetical protein
VFSLFFHSTHTLAYTHTHTITCTHTHTHRQALPCGHGQQCRRGECRGFVPEALHCTTPVRATHCRRVNAKLIYTLTSQNTLTHKIIHTLTSHSTHSRVKIHTYESKYTLSRLSCLHRTRCFSSELYITHMLSCGTQAHVRQSTLAAAVWDVCLLGVLLPLLARLLLFSAASSLFGLVELCLARSNADVPQPGLHTRTHDGSLVDLLFRNPGVLCQDVGESRVVLEGGVEVLQLIERETVHRPCRVCV